MRVSHSSSVSDDTDAVHWPIAFNMEKKVCRFIWYERGEPSIMDCIERVIWSWSYNKSYRCILLDRDVLTVNKTGKEGECQGELHDGWDESNKKGLFWIKLLEDDNERQRRCWCSSRHSFQGTNQEKWDITLLGGATSSLRNRCTGTTCDSTRKVNCVVGSWHENDAVKFNTSRS